MSVIAAERPRAYRDITVGELLASLARDYPKHDALVYPDRGLRYDFTELEWVSRRIARGLLDVGVEAGDRVALWAPNIPEWVVLQFALAKIGAILVTVNTSLKSTELEYLLDQSETSTLITVAGFRDNDYVESINRIVPELRGSEEGCLKSAALPFLKSVIYIGEEHPSGMLRYDCLLERSERVSDEDLDAHLSLQSLDTVINMQYTSGTTGFPKGVMLTHRNIVNNGYWLGEGLALTDQDRLCVPVPFFHCFGCVIGVLGAYTHAAALIPLVTFDPLRALQYIEAERCTALYGVPTMFIAEIEELETESFNLSSLRTGIMAGSLCPE